MTGTISVLMTGTISYDFLTFFVLKYIPLAVSQKSVAMTGTVFLFKRL